MLLPGLPVPDHDWEGQPAWPLILLTYILAFSDEIVVLTSKRIPSRKETQVDWVWKVYV